MHPFLSLCRSSALSAGEAPPLEPLGKLFMLKLSLKTFSAPHSLP